ncbi:MAG TPA: histidine phosphatase family protein [Methanocorpusculum sp.]|nr:histidine phosphatase family protein [Methanocorpusculum sp.]
MNFPEVSTDKTHHTLTGSPIYDKRFREIREYHFPGLAAAKDETGWFHIDLFGNSVYLERYLAVGDFYDNTAKVKDENGWHYIAETGRRIDPMNFIWGSNFNNGIACVYHAKYGATHITTSGELVYNNWYYDVRPFENGKAKVRNENGWHLIDKEGNILKSTEEPADNYPRGTVYQKNRPNRIAELVKLYEYDACVILIRHAEREPFYRGEKGLDKRITTRGEKIAEELAKNLPLIEKAYASTIPRCLKTAEFIAETVIKDTCFGNPGLYIYDDPLSNEYYVEHDTISAIRSYIKGEILPGHRPIEQGTALFLRHIQEIAENGKCILVVTHDAFIVSFIAVLTGYDFSDDWIDFLDGCVLFRKNQQWTLCWREGTVVL